MNGTKAGYRGDGGRTRGFAFVLAGVLAVGIFLRLFRLGSSDLWYDEAVSFCWPISIAKNAPLFFFIIHLWLLLVHPFRILAAGWPEFLCRLPSAMASIASLFALYMCAGKMFSRRAALYSLFLLALSPFHLWYAQEMRSYALAVLLTIASTYFFWAWSYDTGRKLNAAVLCVACATLSVLSHYICSIFVFLMAAHALVVQKSPKRALALLSPFLVFLLWLPFLYRQLIAVSRGFWPLRPTPQSFIITLGNCVLGYNGTKTLMVITLAALLVLCAALLMQAAKNTRYSPGLIYCSGMFFLPMVTMYLFSQRYPVIYIERNFLVFTPFLYMLLGSALSEIKIRVVKVAVAGALCIALSGAIVRYFQGFLYQPQDIRFHMGVQAKKPFRPLAHFLFTQRRAEDYIVIANHAPLFPVSVYMRSLTRGDSGYAAHLFYAYDPDTIDTNWQRPAREIYASAPPPYIAKDALLADILKGGQKKVFFIGCDWERSGALDDNSQRVKEAFDRKLALLDTYAFDGIWVYVYGAGDAARYHKE